MLDDDSRVGIADGARGLDEFLLLEREELRANEPGHRHPLQDPDDRDDHDEDPDLGPEHRPQRVAEEIDDDQQERQDREREKEIGEPHERVVEPAEVARERADRHPERDRDDHRGQADRDRDASTPERAREDVPAQVVGAERMVGGWPLQRLREVDRVHLGRPDIGADEGRDDEERKHYEPGHGELVAPELVPRVAPEGARRAKHVRLHRRRGEPGLGGRH